jgi:hypothetical protein
MLNIAFMIINCQSGILNYHIKFLSVLEIKFFRIEWGSGGFEEHSKKLMDFLGNDWEFGISTSSWPLKNHRFPINPTLIPQPTNTKKLLRLSQY